MPPFQQAPSLLDGVPAVRFGDGIAFLNVGGDSYSCLYDPAELTAAEILPDARAIADGPSPTAASIRRWRALHHTDAKVRLRDVRHFVSALIVASIRFRSRDFAGLLGTDIIGKRRRAAPSENEAAALVTRFESMSLLLPFPMLCLFRSFFLLHFLARHGHGADWVFGVTLFPFRAHCWLAIGDTLIGEASQRAAEYSPILVLADGHS